MLHSNSVEVCFVVDSLKLHTEVCDSTSVVEFFSLLCVLFQVLRNLLPAAGLQAQDDPRQSGGDAQRLLAHPHFHLLPTHHAKLERHRHRGYREFPPPRPLKGPKERDVLPFIRGRTQHKPFQFNILCF